MKRAFSKTRIFTYSLFFSLPPSLVGTRLFCFFRLHSHFWIMIYGHFDGETLRKRHHRSYFISFDDFLSNINSRGTARKKTHAIKAWWMKKHHFVHAKLPFCDKSNFLISFPYKRFVFNRRNQTQHVVLNVSEATAPQMFHSFTRISISLW